MRKVAITLAMLAVVVLLPACGPAGYKPAHEAAPAWITQPSQAPGAIPVEPAQRVPELMTEAYDHIDENPFLAVKQNPLSTFSIDVDTASYANVRRFLNDGRLPPAGAVRIEEFVNYFDYDYPNPKTDEPFSVNVEVAACPWQPEHRLARIGLEAREIETDKRPLSNLVFLLDVSGSMGDPNKLPLLKRAMKLLVEQLGENDRVAIVVYAGAAGLVLPSTSCDHKEAVLAAVEKLGAGGSTAGGEGLKLAYRVAEEHFIQGGVNRVIIGTDGDFNVGPSSQDELVRLIEEKAKGGVFLTVLGFGMGNYKDSTLEKLADKGNGNYAYIDTLNEARKVLVREMGATLVTVAKDVKIQIELNPAKVQAYRLIGYENRLLRAEDFHDDTKDAGEIGAGHAVTALYQIVPPGVAIDLPKADALKYQQPAEAGGANPEMMTVKLRYKAPDSQKSKLIEIPVADQTKPFAEATPDLKFAASVASFGMLLRSSAHKGSSTFEDVEAMAKQGAGADKHGYRAELMELVRKAQTIRAR